jgi:hypothetical protein
MTAMANMCKRSGAVESIFPAAAPWADQHAFSDRLAAAAALAKIRKNPLVAFCKRLAPGLLPIDSRLFIICGMTIFERSRSCFLQGGEHLARIGESLIRIDFQRHFHEFNKLHTGFLQKPIVPSERPIERPLGQKARYEFVKDQGNRKTIASVSWIAVRLLRGDVAGRAEIIDNLHPALDLQCNAEIPECRSLVVKEKNIVWRDIAMDNSVAMCVAQSLEYLFDYEYYISRTHAPGAVLERSGTDIGGQDSVPVDHVSVLDWHYMSVSKLGEMSYLLEQGVVVSLARGADLWYL